MKGADPCFHKLVNSGKSFILMLADAADVVDSGMMFG